jgi:hypothetical protein
LAKRKTSVIIDEDLWRKFKAQCVLGGLKVGVALEQLISEFLEKHVSV